MLVWSFLAFVPQWNTMLVSLVVSCIPRATSAKGAWAAAETTPRRFVAASELGLSELLWEPTKMTGIGRFLRAKLRAADEYPRVSVPWVITTPSDPSFTFSPILRAIPVHCSASMFSLKVL